MEPTVDELRNGQPQDGYLAKTQKNRGNVEQDDVVEKLMRTNAPPTRQAETLKMMRMSIVWMSFPANGEATVIVRYMTVTYKANAVVGTPKPSATTG